MNKATSRLTGRGKRRGDDKEMVRGGKKGKEGKEGKEGMRERRE